MVDPYFPRKEQLGVGGWRKPLKDYIDKVATDLSDLADEVDQINTNGYDITPHLNAPDPHPVYLLKTDAAALYDPLGAAGLVDDHVDAVESEVTTLGSDVATLETTVSTISSDVGDLQAGLSQAETDISFLDTQVSAHDAAIAALEAAVDALEAAGDMTGAEIVAALGGPEGPITTAINSPFTTVSVGMFVSVAASNIPTLNNMRDRIRQLELALSALGLALPSP